MLYLSELYGRIGQILREHGHIADMMIKMGRGEEALKAMFDAKMKGKQ